VPADASAAKEHVRALVLIPKPSRAARRSTVRLEDDHRDALQDLPEEEDPFGSGVTANRRNFPFSRYATVTIRREEAHRQEVEADEPGHEKRA